MPIGIEIKSRAKWVGIALLVLIGWCAIMAAYLAVYETLETNAVPVSFGAFKDFEADQWDSGFFHAKGSYKNNAALDDGDEMIPEVNDITCQKVTSTCTIATADVHNHYLDLDVSRYNVDTWTDKQITFSDDSSICAESHYLIDRTSRTFNLSVRKKSPIPDYALKSPLHPCDILKDKDITLENGFPIYWHLRQRFEQRNGIYFHALLLLLNVVYFGGLFIWFRRRHQRRASPATSGSSPPASA